jgi:hypothetical protein
MSVKRLIKNKSYNTTIFQILLYFFLAKHESSNDLLLIWRKKEKNHNQNGGNLKTGWLWIIGLKRIFCIISCLMYIIAVIKE